MRRVASKTYSRTYYLANKAKVKARSAKWAKANPEKCNSKNKIWRNNNAAKVKVCNQNWRNKNLEKDNADKKAWRLRNKERDKATSKLWQINNLDKCRDYCSNRRARINSAKGYTSTQDIKQILLNQNYACVYCNADLNLTGYHADHIIPISKGGSNYPHNYQLLCPICNFKKQAKMPWDYEKEIGFERESNFWDTLDELEAQEEK